MKFGKKCFYKSAEFSALSDESGQSILESILSMLALLIVLLGLLQIFQLATAKLLTNYSAFRSIRSYVVGFEDHLIARSSRVAAIGASGKMVYPDNESYSSPQAQFEHERIAIPYYISGTRWMEYEYWFGQNEYNPNYYHQSVIPPQTSLGYSLASSSLGESAIAVSFDSYPFAILDMADRNRVWLTLGESTDISSTAGLMNHSADYLNDN
ncbi:MAG TPA: hypothetical protein PK821_06130 [Victivallales bacterium]|nr:hypothetical protein [Victivallales bacterium]